MTLITLMIAVFYTGVYISYQAQHKAEAAGEI